MRIANEILRFALELCALVGLFAWGRAVGDGGWAEWMIALGAPLAFACIWGAWIAPKAHSRLTDPGRLALEIVLFLAVGALLVSVDHGALGVAFSFVAIANALLVRRWSDTTTV